ncbi:PREDICTED: lathosterol oxidase-like [Nicrophorus vespilloides]|uniref:Lathosterol oxidase-like n=1 Tax=Nicrophorus vespilloides TaxID=110193 RepID=A0ABM1MCG9_NICVS|nr:PREDICTED: lathosterol oxidase-like [Nicrophorus vespilloides]
MLQQSANLSARRSDDLLLALWTKLPKFLATSVATFLICSMGLSSNGEWINIIVHAARQFGYVSRVGDDGVADVVESLESRLGLRNLGTFLIWNIAVSYLIYFGLGGFLHWYFYVEQRAKAEEWKCQPKRWLSPELERDEIVLGTCTLFVHSSISAVLSCYISNGGYTTIYYGLTDYPLWWTLLQIPILYVYQDYTTYLLHRLYHTPFMYKNFHKLHHKYKQPTAFSVNAMHPLEAAHIQMHYIVPLFVVPLHWAIYYGLQLYIYYHGIIDHSGVDFKAHWWQPWQPDAIFHDNHHQYYHVNFGFNCFIWDKLHGTHRREDRIYNEGIFYGGGKPLSAATPEERIKDYEERLNERAT